MSSVVKLADLKIGELEIKHIVSLVDAYYTRGGNSMFSDRALDIFIETPQKDRDVENIRTELEEYIYRSVKVKFDGSDVFRTMEGRRFVDRIVNGNKNS